MCCRLKEKLEYLWDHTMGAIKKVNEITPDGDGNFTIEAGSNIALSETGTGNGIRIDTTGGVSYYESGDSYVNVDNNDLEISVNVGTGGLATDTDLQTVAQAVTDILDGTSTVPEATHATSADNATNAVNATNATNATYAGSATNALYLGSVSSNVGTDTKPIKIVNGQAVPVGNDLVSTFGTQLIDGDKRFIYGSMFCQSKTQIVGTTPSTDSTMNFYFTDKNGAPMGQLQFKRSSDGTFQWYIGTVKNNNTVDWHLVHSGSL